MTSKRFEIATTAAVAAFGMAMSGYMWLYGCAKAADGLNGCSTNVPQHWVVMAFLFWFLFACLALYAITASRRKEPAK